MDNPPLAHSARDNVPAQLYVEHIMDVRCRANQNACRAADFHTGDHESFVNWVDAAAIYHDLGKLDEVNQATLRQQPLKRLPIAHEDAGIAELDRLGHLESVTLVAAHHAGLFSLKKDVLCTQARPFRQLGRKTPAGISVADHVDTEGRLDNYRKIHVSAGCPETPQVESDELHRCGFIRRLALSCLVDADHGDTARHYEREVEVTKVETRWKNRAAALQRYVDGLPKGKTKSEKHRNQLRRQVYEACRDAAINPSIRSCDAPVGSGKTTAIMAHLLRVAHEKRLRHIFVVLPYTNIITQSVQVLRKALVLEGERPEEVVAEHHHKADFEDIELRQLATLWKAPIIVTTAVQFFETLGSHHPARLRKLHELPGSAVFIDETHAAMPSHLWPQAWRWLETWTREWGGYLVLASGSLSRFWELEEYRDLIRGRSDAPTLSVPDLVTSHELKRELREAEGQRVLYQRRLKNKSVRERDSDECEPALNCENLIEFIASQPGPRLLVVNTVQTAAVVARAMRDNQMDVLHLSTSLAPAHRELVIERIKLRLRENKRIEDWTLVATSCVEAGMDFSFRTGFRERASTASLLQIAGRINRDNEYAGAKVWDLLLRDDTFRHNPSIVVAQNALNRFSENQLNKHAKDPAMLATLAMRQEWTCGAEQKASQLMEAEEGMEYPDVAMLSRVIDADTRTVIVDRAMAESVRRHRKISKAELLRYSVQIWTTKIDRLRLEPIYHNCEFYEWCDEYDPAFLGYMAGVLQTEAFLHDPEACVI